ncbi:hypothetical protein ACFVZ3_20690 [Kitasatospora purpeofusca]|uniref:hypothetical protein n=1 Tax=Kitasatospora purpeofusca TaxID=67352 RepID=UPI0036B7F454
MNPFWPPDRESAPKDDEILDGKSAENCGSVSPVPPQSPVANEDLTEESDHRPASTPGPQGPPDDVEAPGAAEFGAAAGDDHP